MTDHHPAPVDDPSPAARRVAIAGLLVGLALVVTGAFLPWVLSGATSRSSFAMVRSADRLGIVDDGIGLAVLRAWYLVPLLAAGVVVLVTLHRPRTAAAVGLALSLVVSAIAVIVLVAAPEAGSGPAVCVLGAISVVVASVALLRPQPRPGAVPPG